MLPGVLYTVSCSLFFFTTYLLKIGTYYPLGPPQFCISLTANGPQYQFRSFCHTESPVLCPDWAVRRGYFLDGRLFPATLCWMRPER